MGIRKALFGFVAAALLIGSGSAYAEDPTADRATTVQMIKNKYIPTLDDQHQTLLTLKIKAKVDAGLLKQVNTVLKEFDSNYASIVNGLANPNQALQPIIDLCEEEVEEFGNYIYQLQLQAAKIKTITCVKGKTIKKITAVSPACPTGYKKK